MQYADFEIGLHKRSAENYSVEVIFREPGDEADNRRSGEGRFDLNQLRELETSPAKYGQALSDGLFASAETQVALANALSLIDLTNMQAKARGQEPQMGLRVRLIIGPSAPELFGLHWEKLTLPKSSSPLSANETIPFSRYLSSRDWRRVHLRSKSQLKALVVVANPNGLEESMQVKVDEEIQRARDNLGDLPVTTLPGEGGSRASLSWLIDCLRDGQHDILYLVCHGGLVNNEPTLLLEDDAGEKQFVSGNDLVNRLVDLPERPRLVVLLSCQSAAPGKGGVLAAVGPKLVEAGIPAVLAMQGDFSMETAQRMMPVFFRHLAQEGQIDRALAIARGTALAADPKCADFWMPVLFNRLKDGQVWYVPRFSVKEGVEFDAWQPLKNAITEQRCTPVLGPGVMEAWLGLPDEIARNWADNYQYPLAPDDRDELPRVAQFISRRDGVGELQSAYFKALREEILKRHKAAVPEKLLKANFWTEDQVLKAIKGAAEQRWDSPATLVHRQLADLRLPIYITTCVDDLLADALRKRGANPTVKLCPWWGPQEEEREEKCLYDEEPDEDNPLVYHLYGHLNTADSLVLSEDDYFDFLIGVWRNKSYIPPIIGDVLMRTSLMFIGFRTDDWAYRVLFRMLIAQKGVAQFLKNRHANAQVEPEEGRLIDIRRARSYLETVFTKTNIAIYWGRSEDFMRDLTLQLQEK